MPLEDQLSELREHVRELQALVVSIITEEKVAQLDEHNLLFMSIAQRAGTDAFDLQRRYRTGIGGGGYGWFVRPAWKRTAVDPDVVAYVERLRRLGMQIEVEPSTAVTAVTP